MKSNNVHDEAKITWSFVIKCNGLKHSMGAYVNAAVAVEGQ